MVELRSEGYFLSHANHKLAVVDKYKGLGELWYIQKIPGTNNQIRIQARAGEYFRFLAHDDA